MSRGFTLLEALIAMALLAIALSALMAGHARAVRTNARMRETGAARRAMASLAAQSLAGDLTSAVPEECCGCKVTPWEQTWPESGEEARLWQGFAVTAPGCSAPNVILPLAGQSPGF